MAASVVNVHEKCFDDWSPNRKGYRHFNAPTDESYHFIRTVVAEHGLALTGKIGSNFSIRGCCEGGSFVVISLCLAGYSIDDLSSFKAAYYENLDTIILIQKIQKRLYGIFRGSSPSKNIVSVFREAFMSEAPDSSSESIFSVKKDSAIWNSIYRYVIKFLQSPLLDNECLRRAILNFMTEHEISITPILYENILEITTHFDMIFRSSKKPCGYLEKDVITALGSIAGFKCKEVVSVHGQLKHLVWEISQLQKGVYHIGLPFHACVYIKQCDRVAYLWDISKGFIKMSIGENDRKLLKKHIKLFLFRKMNWMTIYSCSN